ncbi:MAG: lipocalin family protein [Maribacter sp.]|nr:lipocalin family protein [Maribacter sp.]
MMKNYSLLGVLALFLLFSCSSDKEADVVDANAIIGTWDATELMINNETASDDAKNARDILNFLTAQDCYILSFTFNSDLSVTADNSSNYVEISVNSAGTGLEIPCPTESDTEASTYTFDGMVLTILDGNGETVSVDASIEGDIMTVDAADLDIPNFNDCGEFVFIKR